MHALELQQEKAMRWDTNDNKIYFDTERWKVRGRLVLRKGADGKIDMYISKAELPSAN
ncbi:hypothetical protein [Anaeroselena agilis]|uniref:Uncharacterized protein n=1 Tax=Anaeroselena agilis TaxID=3063788 RepID=A0ABU3P1Z0_9FIRM|nr:hypothetical protein [Selenomonadales bacterium 4137-cl]